MSELAVREVSDMDKPWIIELLNNSWGSVEIISKGNVYNAAASAGLIAEIKGKAVGLLTYEISGDLCEVISLNSLLENKGVGSRLIKELVDLLKTREISRISLITTNDNIGAIKFFQKRGFYFKAVYPGAIEYSRHLKPQIPLQGNYGIPIRDEIELELTL